MNSRKTARENLQAALDTIGTLQAVYDRLPSKFEVSPVATVTSRGTINKFDTLEAPHRAQVLMVTLWWERKDDTIEDRLDDLSEEVYDLLESQTGLDVGQVESTIDYPIVDGTQYIIERIVVEVW